MSLKWSDSLEIAIALSEKHSDVDPKTLVFMDLREMILSLDGFDDDPAHCGERVLEGIQMAWIDEVA